MTRYAPMFTETLATLASGQPAPERAPAGSCEIRLVADCIASLRTGSTHKVYRGWRFEVVLGNGHLQAGRTLFAIPIDPVHWAASRSRYALAQQADQGAIAIGGSAAFSWSATAIGPADPLAAAHEEARRWLVGAGWNQDATTPTRYMKPDPTDCGGLERWEAEGGSTIPER